MNEHTGVPPDTDPPRDTDVPPADTARPGEPGPAAETGGPKVPPVPLPSDPVAKPPQDAAETAEVAPLPDEPSPPGEQPQPDLAGAGKPPAGPGEPDLPPQARAAEPGASVEAAVAPAAAPEPAAPEPAAPEPLGGTALQPAERTGPEPAQRAESEPAPAGREPVGAADGGQLPLELSLPQQGPDGELDDPARLAAAIEAVLFVVDTPIAAADLAEVLGVPVARMERALAGLRDAYHEQGRGLDLREVAGGWRLYTREDYARYVERYVLDGQQTRLTQAALETLAVIAYRQPVTRSRIAAIRGVGVDGVMRTLLTRGLVEECGTDPTTSGNLYRTTSLFLEKLGLRSLDELPSLAPLLPEIDAVDDVATSA